MVEKKRNCDLRGCKVKWALVFSWGTLPPSPNGIFMRLHMVCLILLILFPWECATRHWAFLEIFIRDMLCNFPSYCFWHSIPLFLVWVKNEMNALFLDLPDAYAIQIEWAASDWRQVHQRLWCKLSFIYLLPFLDFIFFWAELCDTFIWLESW